MNEYIKISAVEWTGLNFDEIYLFAGKKAQLQTDKSEPGSPKISLRIENLEGTSFVSIGDMITKGLDGEFYTVNPDVFKKTYHKINHL